MKIKYLLFLLVYCNICLGQIKQTLEKKMKIAVWDTYVKVESGEVVHFDILVPDEVKDVDKVFAYGKDYLDSKKVKGKLDTKHCQFCHIEEASPEMISAIDQKGFDIIEMETIPVKLQDNPTRRQMILFLRGHYDQYRFAEFKGKSEEEIKEIIKQVNKLPFKKIHLVLF